ncbi:hypothetical protein SO802_006009 [Lithocarpus litseifolius]|uniref:Uncharacterized protein n=1 Tax=Lithocarpus litseifolius TaxID=425828 RepID=A0AAW2DKF3_9ROSI
MPMAKLYAYPLEKKLVTPIFAKLKDGPHLLGFDPSKKDLIDKNLVQFDNIARSNAITSPLPPHQERNVNAISFVEKRIPDFSSPTFPWKAMLQALAHESHIVLEKIGAPGFD